MPVPDRPAGRGAGGVYAFSMPRLFAALLMLLFGCISSPALLAADVAEARSVLLIAAEGMADPRFRQSVVLVTRHGRSRSTIGVIVNRALDLSLAPLFPGLEAAARHRLHYGGPVAPGQIVFLVRAETAPAAAINLAERLFISSDGEGLRRLLDAATPDSRLRVFRGIASWVPNQLEVEIDRGDWYLLPVDADALFNEALDDLWPKLWRRATQVMVRAPASVSPVEIAAWRPPLR
ncbi:MAG: YqgE/AlgH family protein [Sterolibacteriaceae bacterium]|uniref:YqgE/AlgH family protein n=1 Tax=Sulfuritalea sp. TaxID=2480090 RepID=UPI001A41BDF1|nr:YqgE/AlgH family protein [Sulfuritalea sp.]MBL8478641.1 YqgE/AlgH family protein [Sterolibacteriaceae bacterium]MBN8476457.1 YqgE/AlgH family protein [Sulfuritalea sp.]